MKSSPKVPGGEENIFNTSSMMDLSPLSSSLVMYHTFCPVHRRSVYILESLGAFIAEFEKDGVGFHRPDDILDLNNQPAISITVPFPKI